MTARAEAPVQAPLDDEHTVYASVCSRLVDENDNDTFDDDIGEISPAFAPFGPYLNWLEIFYRGTVAEDVAVSAEVEPLFVASGLLKIQTRPTGPGDVNVDYALDLTDVMAILGELFLGTNDILCAEAADFDGNERVDISDPIGILGYLFLGDAGPPPAEILCGKGEI